MTIGPLAHVRVDPSIAALPKADLHLHQEAMPRLERLAARRLGRSAYDWRAHARRVLDGTPPGFGRLTAIYAPDPDLDLGGVPASDPENCVAMVADILEEGAADGAVLVEVRFGRLGCGTSPPDFMPLFREAERRVRRRYPRLRAEAIAYLSVRDDPALLRAEEQRLDACIRAARAGLGGVDFRVDPYDTEADPALWAVAYRWAERAAAAGLGVTVHAGEFSPANLAAALRVPGLSRLGHAVYAAADPRLLEALAASGATVECSLTSNVVLGAAPSYEAHPIRRFVESGIPVTLNTDLPVHACTTIGREYAIAAALGFSPAELLAFTRNAVRASFASAERRAALLDELHGWEATLPAS
jgi:adenosine deaminase